jgi:hypothetical protein
MFKNGDIVYDKVEKEIFVYNEKSDKYVVTKQPERFELSKEQ